MFILFYCFIYLLMYKVCAMKNLDIEKIKELYLRELKTTKEVGEIVGCSLSTVNRILKKEGVQLRDKGNIKGKEYHIISPFKQKVENIEQMKVLFNSGVPINKIAQELCVSPKAVDRKVKELGLKRTVSMMSRDLYDDSNDEKIIELYKEGKSTTEIAKIVGITHRTVIKHLSHCGVDRRTLSQSHFIKNNKQFPEELKDFQTVYDLYVERRLSKKDIAEQFDVSPNVVNRALKELGIQKRSLSEAKIGLFSGEKHPNWKGGRSGLYVRLREYFRCHQVKQTIERDGNKCQMCGRKNCLHVHHIKPFKEIFNEILSENSIFDVKNDEEKLFKIMINDPRMNDMNNLVTYCRDCHLFKVHGYKKHKVNG